jgi:hypothetical protein
LDRLSAVTNEAPALQLEHPERPDQLRLLGGAEVCSLGAHDVSDRDRVTRVGLPRPPTVALAMGAPGWHLQHLKPSAGESCNQAASVAARALDADHGVCGVLLEQPVDQSPIALRGVWGDQRRDLSAAVIDECGGVVVLVNVDADDQGGLLSGG